MDDEKPAEEYVKAQCDCDGDCGHSAVQRRLEEAATGVELQASKHSRQRVCTVSASDSRNFCILVYCDQDCVHKDIKQGDRHEDDGLNYSSPVKLVSTSSEALLLVFFSCL